MDSQVSDKEQSDTGQSQANSTSSFRLISDVFVAPSPVPSTSSGSSTLDKRPHMSLSQSSSGSSSPIDGYFIRTTEADKNNIRDAWAKFFFKNSLSFNLVDDPTFCSALEMTQPNINGDNGKKPLLTRKMLSGKLLDSTGGRIPLLPNSNQVDKPT